MGNKFIWPMMRFWEDSPLQWICKGLWNISELLNVRLPFAPQVFGIIMGKPGKRIDKEAQ